MRLLIIEDEEQLLDALKRGLMKCGYAVDTAEDGITGSEMAYQNEYDVIILDLNLPGKDGIEVLKDIRTRSMTTKVLILSARSSVPDKIKGLDLGANDYLGKPFDFLELEARIRNLIRRDFVQQSTVIHLQNLTLDTAQKSAAVNGHKLDLQPKEYAILEYMALHSGTVISAEELIEHIWDEEADMFSMSVKVHISNLRKKISAYGDSSLIVTVRGEGYMIAKGDSHE